MPNYLATMLVFGIAAGTFATTVSQSALFKPLRAWVASWWEWGGDLISCPYCLGHWASLFMLLEVDNFSWMWTIGTWLATTGIAALTSGLITTLHTGGGDDH